MRTLLLFVLASLVLVGCQPAAEAEKAPAPEKKAEAKDGASAIANGEELQVNPNGKMDTPGSKLGGN